eukprot:Clim_evm88s142 gene=Clim_evmTU88s142
MVRLTTAMIITVLGMANMVMSKAVTAEEFMAEVVPGQDNLESACYSDSSCNDKCIIACATSSCNCGANNCYKCV